MSGAIQTIWPLGSGSKAKNQFGACSLILCAVFAQEQYGTLPLYLYSITNNFNKGIQYDKISTTDIQKAHRRCLCACGCYSFGDAFELWAGLEVEDAKKEEEAEKPPEKEGVTKTPTKPNQEPDKDYLIPKAINPEARDLICQDIRDSGHQEQILKEFKEHFKLKVKQVRPENITLSEHGRFLRQAVEKYKDD